MSTAYTFAPALAHTLRGHPESHQRLAGLLPFLEEHDALDGLTRLAERPATEEEVARVHTRQHIRNIQQLALRGGGHLNPDTYLTPDSYELALLAAGACQVAVDHILTQEGSNGLALVRPPGHHAFAGRGEGFCLFNNVALAARHAQAVHGVQRIFLLDFDVHHGNGTQAIFYEDATVLFVSLHMYASFFYPGSGGVNEIGNGPGRGYTINVPFPPGVGDQGYRQALEELILPRARHFRPELILVSAGFDAHWRDPLAAAGLSLSGYDTIIRALLQLAAGQCAGRILFVLEGGYFHPALHHGILNLILALTGREAHPDFLGPLPTHETDVTNLLSRLKTLHLPN